MSDKVFVCGNCGEVLGNDKYCKYCGTEREKGRFVPQNNEVCIVYGPPVKQKFRCSSCGYNWVSIVLGGEHCEYCPKCGEKSFKEIRRDVMNDGMISASIIDSFDDENRPVFLSKNQVEYILQQRNTGMDFDSEKIAEILEQMNFSVPQIMDSYYFIGTEEEYERMTLIERILRMDGDNPKFNQSEHCPCCGSTYHAAIGYTLSDSDYNVLCDCAHVKADCENPVIYDRNYWFDAEIENPAYYCLQCGTEYGQFIMD